MRILHITPDYAPASGGAELYVKEVSERLAARGHDMSVLALNSRGLTDVTGATLPSHDVINDVRVRRLNHTYTLHRRFFRVRGTHRALALALDGDRLQMLSSTPCSLAAFLLTLRAHADVVAVANWYHASLAYQTALASDFGQFTLVGVPLFHTEQSWAVSPLFARILAKCDGVVAMTDHEKRFVMARSAQPAVEVAGAGVDPGLFQWADGASIRRRYGIGDAPVVGYVGRMSATKGVVTILRAMQGVWRRYPDARLLLAGSGLPSSARCDEEVRRAFAALSDADRSRVIEHGSFTDAEKPSIFDALDVFAMSSVAESFGIAYLEAWMCRKPVIGARVGSTACVIDDGTDGLLATLGDADDLERKLAVLLSDPQSRERMGQAGHAKVLQAFTWDKVADRVERVYERAHAKSRQDRAKRPAA